MTIVLAIVGFVALGIASWITERIISVGWDEFWKRTSARLRIRTATHVADPDEIQMSSRFAVAAEDFEDVLRLRRSFFGHASIVPDDTYRTCWRQNRYSMKIVYYLNEPLGYWSVIPVELEAFRRFLSGELSHDDMLTKHCKSWGEIETDEVYLYIIGVVVPPRGAQQNKLNSLLQKLLSGHVLLDAYAFAYELGALVTVKGVCGYPSRTGGYETLMKMPGFKKSSTLIDADESQPVFVSTGSDVMVFRNFLQQIVEKHLETLPSWEGSDRRKLFDLFRTRPQEVG